jgi:chemotaxis protein MotB
MAKSDAPIIVIKRVKKGGHGHHGGAWKIAYADFVTAMMAFFLLMWVLGSTTAGDLAGISSYFQNPLRVSLSGGQGSGDATRIIKGGGDNITKTVGEESRADADTVQRRISDSSVTDVENARKDKTKNEIVKEDIEKKIDADPELKNSKGQVFMDINAEGLRIQVVDEKGKPLFSSGGSVQVFRHAGYCELLVNPCKQPPAQFELKATQTAQNTVMVKRATPTGSYQPNEQNVARRELITGGLDPARVVQVIGFANTVPLNPEDLNDPLNRRISITVLNKKPKQEEKPIVRPVEKLPEGVPKGAQEIPVNLRAPAQFLSKDNAPKSPAMEIPPKVSPSPDKSAR